MNKVNGIPSWIQASSCIQRSISAGAPIVALESSLITNGLPKPVNLEVALQIQTKIKASGVEPATVAVMEGQVRLGLSTKELERLALADDVEKISRRDFGPAIAKKWTGGTTVAGTMIVASAAGIRIFATGGIGGVHRGDAGDVSTDLTELAKTPMAVVCSGAKAILDLPKTLEWLETVGVPVIGWQTDEFPAFLVRNSGLPVSSSADSLVELVEILQKHWEVGGMGALICIPCPEEAAVDPNLFETAYQQAENDARQANISGKALTPFLLNRLSELTNGTTLHANLALLLENAFISAQIARAMQESPSGS
jgi:pseudouridine-5'-phosphate glycosidase